MLAEAAMGRRSSARSTSGPSPWTVIGMLLVAVSLVVVGTFVVLDSLNASGGSISRAPDPTPTTDSARSTPIVLTVGPRVPGQEAGSTPVTGGTGAPSVADTARR